MSNGLTANGFEVDDYDTILEDIIIELKDRWPDLRETDSNPLIVWAKYNAQSKYDTNLQALSKYNDLNAYTATGKAQDDIYKVEAIFRKKSTQSTGYIKIVANEGTSIPAFWAVKTPSNVRFRTTNLVSETVDETGELILEVRSALFGSDNNVEINRITVQEEVVTGVISITNEEPTSGGTDEETDTPFRNRYFLSLRTSSLFSKDGIAQYILDNTEASRVFVIDNEEDTVDSYGIPPHSIGPYVVGDTDENILDALIEYKVAGIKTHGAITKTKDGLTVGFTRPPVVDLYCEINITSDSTWRPDDEDTITEAVQDYVAGVGPGQFVYIYNIVGETYKKSYGPIKTINVKLDDVDPPVAVVDYKLEQDEIARILTQNLKINVVIT